MSIARTILSATLGLVLVLTAPPVRSQLMQNLRSFSNSVSVIDPVGASAGGYEKDGPKEIAAGDFDGDGKVAVTVVHGHRWAPGLSVLTGEGNGTIAPRRCFPPTDRCSP
jgi:hypothetical protein